MPTQNTDLSGDTYGILYGASGVTWKIAKGVSVSGTEAGVAGTFADSTLVNKGTIGGGFGGGGVVFGPGLAPGDFLIKNQKSGRIAESFGIIVGGFDGSVTLKNKGRIDGANAAFDASGSGAVTVLNSGQITAQLHGLRISFSTSESGADIDNTGTIKSAGVGILAYSLEGARVAVHNHKGALIEGSGGAGAIGVNERLVLKNEGKIKGNIESGNFADKIVSSGKIKGDMFLGSGDDKLVLKGKGKVTGLIDAGPGNDKVVFGKAADKFLFDSGLDAATNVKTFKNFASGKDKLFLDLDIFTTLTPGKLLASEYRQGKEAKDADDRIIYDKKTGALYYDPDGSGGVAQTKFAQLEKGTKLKASDFTAGEFSIAS